MFDPAKLKADFPLLSQPRNGKELSYLDSAATSQKPSVVLDAMDDFYRQDYGSIHRGIHGLSESATERYEDARQTVAEFIGAGDAKEIIFTRGTTDSLNLVAQSWGRRNLKAGDVIVTTVMEHHANFVSWRMLADELGLDLRIVGITAEGQLDAADLKRKLDGAKLLAVTHVSNVLGTINPIAELAAQAHDAGAVVVVDAAQSVPNLPVQVKELGADFVAFSAHKMLGPTGIGVLWGKAELLSAMPPVQGGGQMIQEVTEDDVSFATAPWRFEAGTMPAAEAVGLAAAVDYLKKLTLAAVRDHERDVAAYALQQLTGTTGVTIFGPSKAEDRAGLVSFTVDGVHAHDLATILDEEGIAIRSGHHCAQPLHDKLGVPATARASFSVYSTREDIDRLVAGVKNAQKVFATA